MREEYAIAVTGLRKVYRDVTAIDNLDLAIPVGEVFALLGPNGAGKTTTVEVLEGYRSRDAGEVRVLGVDPRAADADWRSRLGIVLQSTGEFEELTVEEVVRHFAGYYPNPHDPLEVIARVGLGERRRARAKSLSGGQHRRLDVALGIVGRPELLFLDEPTTGFDPVARCQFWQLVRELSAAGTTVLLTTHYLEEAEALADRVGVIVQGRLVDVASPENLGGRRAGLAVVRWREEAATREAVTATPGLFVRDLVDRLGGEVPELVVSRPSLEDAYLSLINMESR